MPRQIKINDREFIEIVNSAGRVMGGFWWNPSDLNIIKRCEKVMDFFEHMEVQKKDDETENLFAISDVIKEQFDFLISPGASEVLFKEANPLSPREDGSLYAEYILGQIVNFIESELKVRIKKTTAKIEQYTSKYKK